MLVHLDIESSCTCIEDMGTERLMWFRLTSKQAVLIIGALYGPPGGDVLFWQQVTREYGLLSMRFASAKFILLGDANIHLSYLVDHNPGCACLHCKQRPVDRDIERLLQAAALRANNPAVQTHVSGTIVDVVFSPAKEPLGVDVSTDNFACSDHACVMCTTDLDVA